MIVNTNISAAYAVNVDLPSCLLSYLICANSSTYWWIGSPVLREFPFPWHIQGCKLIRGLYIIILENIIIENLYFILFSRHK